MRQGEYSSDNKEKSAKIAVRHGIKEAIAYEKLRKF